MPAEVLEALTVTPMTDVADIVAQALEPVTAPAGTCT
ncbi:endopeptidase La [Mycobacterium avium subsp. paratuberculosis]|nr:endopeptidase La [Mycobacterium avium subsp. paratuberculosis]